VTSALPSLEACIPALRRYAYALVRSRQDADDLVQDTLLRALDNLHRFQGEGGIRPWLFTIMHNLFVSQIRKVRARPQHEAFTSEMEASTGFIGAQEDGLHQRDLVAALYALPAEQRTVILLVSVEDLSYSEVARVLGIPIGTVMSRLARGRERLRSLWRSTVAIPESAPNGRPRLLRRVK
jgi:RNA polymerase sigma-70 factor (ECF subfamily)